MIQNYIIKILLFPFSLLYGIGVSIHLFLYEKSILKPVSFDLPTIVVGNLSIGGAGKTPHTEYLIHLLSPHLEIGTLSRGYKRKTSGYLNISSRMNFEQSGDEPLLLKRKYPDVMVTVAESRSLAIPQMLMENPDLKVVILDDAYQHRAIKAGLYILLTEYDLPYTKDYLLPMGRLREWRYTAEKADIIIVTKCPKDLSLEQKRSLTDELAPLAHQQVFFSYYEYGYPYFYLDVNSRIKLDKELDVIVLSGIARTDYLETYLKGEVGFVGQKIFEDHHAFTVSDMENLNVSFKKLESDRKIILTTEKDAMRLEPFRGFIVQNQLPVFILPIKVQFHFEEAGIFDAYIKNYLLNFKV